jgi:hypothetical protein
MKINISLIIEIILLFVVFCKIEPWWLCLLMAGIMVGIIVLTVKLRRSIRDWEGYIKKWNDPELTFEEFYSLYSVMPEKFQLNSFDITYRHKDISFKTYFDYCKYTRFFERYKEQKTEMKRTEIQANLIKELQQDLAAKQEENDQWVGENLKKNVHIGQTSF